MRNTLGIDVTRRELLQAFGSGAVFSVIRAYAAEPSFVAETQYGPVRGAAVRGVHIFRGIP